MQYFFFSQGPHQTLGRGKQWKADWTYSSEGKGSSSEELNKIQNFCLKLLVAGWRHLSDLKPRGKIQPKQQEISTKLCKGFVIQVKAHCILTGVPDGAEMKQEEH